MNNQRENSEYPLEVALAAIRMYMVLCIDVLRSTANIA